MSKQANDIVALDGAHLVHHMAPRRDDRDPAPAIMVHGKGMRLTDSRGNSYLDAVSGMFNVNIGYGRSEIADVAAADIAQLGFAPLFNDLGNAPAARLAAKLADIGPAGVQRYFFTVGGSDAVDSALKFARAFHSLRGEPERTTIIARRRSYHGMSFGALSVTGQPRYWEHFGPMLPDTALFGQPDEEDGTPEALDALIRSRGPETIAAVLTEPISLTAGIVPAPSGYLGELRKICDHYGVLLIVDEVVSGFGRTGAMFALQHEGVAPDLLVLAKAITSGYLPLGAVGMSDVVHQAIVRRDRPLLNGFSAGGHPTSCAVAMKNIEIIEDEDLVGRSAEMGEYFASLLTALAAEDDDVSPPRGQGMMISVEVGPPGDDVEARLATATADALRADGVLVRRYGRAIALGPTLVATPADLEEIVTRLGTAVRAARG